MVCALNFYEGLSVDPVFFLPKRIQYLKRSRNQLVPVNDLRRHCEKLFTLALLPWKRSSCSNTTHL